MTTQITDYTSQEEVQSIYDFYAEEDGSVNYDEISEAIQTGDDSNFAIEDLITAFMQGSGGELPEFMLTPEASMPNPDDFPWLWEDSVVFSLQQLGDLYGNNDGAFGEGDLQSIRDLLSWGETATGTSDDGLVDEIESALEEIGVDEEDSDEVAEEIYNLFNVNDLSEIMTFFLGMGNPGVALLLYTAYGLAPATRELQEAAVEVIEDGNDEMEDLLDDLGDIDPEDLNAQYDSQVISQQLNVVSTVLQTMGQFIQDAQDVIDQMIELASNLSEQASQTTASVTRNIG